MNRPVESAGTGEGSSTGDIVGVFFHIFRSAILGTLS